MPPAPAGVPAIGFRRVDDQRPSSARSWRWPRRPERGASRRRPDGAVDPCSPPSSPVTTCGGPSSRRARSGGGGRRAHQPRRRRGADHLDFREASAAADLGVTSAAALVGHRIGGARQHRDQNPRRQPSATGAPLCRPRGLVVRSPSEVFRPLSDAPRPSPLQPRVRHRPEPDGRHRAAPHDRRPRPDGGRDPPHRRRALAARALSRSPPPGAAARRTSRTARPPRPHRTLG